MLRKLFYLRAAERRCLGDDQKAIADFKAACAPGYKEAMYPTKKLEALKKKWLLPENVNLFLSKPLLSLTCWFFYVIRGCHEIWCCPGIQE